MFPKKIARYDQRKAQRLLRDEGIVRNRLKVASAIRNAAAFLEVQKEFGSFDRYLWAFVGGRPVINRPRTRKQMPARTELSDRISKDLKKRGFRFVGPTTAYALMQATGMVDDHLARCWCRSHTV